MRELNPVWRELGAAMRTTRKLAGMPLRQAEIVSTWSRAMLSQVETWKARPSRSLVRWYDLEYAANGLLLCMDTEARCTDLQRREPGEQHPEDAMEIVHAPEFDDPVPTAEKVDITWQLRNRGKITWRDRRLLRLGAITGARILTGQRETTVRDAAPGRTVEVTTTVLTPSVPGTYAAFWELAQDGRACFPGARPLSAVLTVR